MCRAGYANLSRDAMPIGEREIPRASGIGSRFTERDFSCDAPGRRSDDSEGPFYATRRADCAYRPAINRADGESREHRDNPVLCEMRASSRSDLHSARRRSRRGVIASMRERERKKKRDRESCARARLTLRGRHVDTWWWPTKGKIASAGVESRASVERNALGRVSVAFVRLR